MNFEFWPSSISIMNIRCRTTSNDSCIKDALLLLLSFFPLLLSFIYFFVSFPFPSFYSFLLTFAFSFGKGLAASIFFPKFRLKRNDGRFSLSLSLSLSRVNLDWNRLIRSNGENVFIEFVFPLPLLFWYRIFRLNSGGESKSSDDIFRHRFDQIIRQRSSSHGVWYTGGN